MIKKFNEFKDTLIGGNLPQFVYNGATFGKTDIRKNLGIKTYNKNKALDFYSDEDGNFYDKYELDSLLIKYNSLLSSSEDKIKLEEITPKTISIMNKYINEKGTIN